MRVGLNATCLNERPSGAKQRFIGIYGALFRRCPDIEFVIYQPRDCNVGAWFNGAPNVAVRPTPLPSTGRAARMLKGLGYWRSAFAQDRLDLFETFHLPLVDARNCPTVLTVHDARPVLPEIPLAKRMLHGAVFRRALRRADHVVTVSDAMRRELLAICPEASVSTIYNGIDPAPFNRLPASGEQTRSKLGLPTQFILAVGHLEARKNYIRLIQAVATLRDRGQPISLVIVGNDGGQAKGVVEEINRLSLSDVVRLLSGVTDRELADLYSLCTMVAFPSRYEGFGIPVLEAMAAQRPIVLSDIPVFRELTEDKGVYFPPDDSEAMAGVIADLLSCRERQEKLVSYGRERVRAFTFPQLAAQVEQVYQQLI